MRLQTPYNLSRFAYFGLDTSARSGDELLAFGLGKLYFGIYPTRSGSRSGFEISFGILDENDSLPVWPIVRGVSDTNSPAARPVA